MMICIRLTVLLALLAGPGGAAAATDSRSVAAFDRIAFSVPGELVLVQGKTPQVTLEGQAEDLQRISVSVKDGQLDLSWEGSSWFGRDGTPDDRIRVTATTPALSGLEVSGSGRVGGGTWAAEAFVVELDGSGDIRFDALAGAELHLGLAGSGSIHIGEVDAPEVRVELMGSGDVELKGSVTRLDVQLMGSGDVLARDLEGAEVTVQLMGSGGVQVWAAERLNARVVGSGDVRYRGSPVVERQELGSGAVAAL